MSKIKINDLVNLSKNLGQYCAYVQGGGGNVSIKLDETQMIVKASGYLLKDLTLEKGYSLVNYPLVRQYIKNGEDNEDGFSKKIRSFASDKYPRPSIETGFHAWLGTCVAHTHSVYANIINCSKEGQRILSKLFPKANWVAYASPGKDLTKLICKTVDESSKPGESIIFLQNHGLIVAGDTAKIVLDLHESVNATIKDYFSLEDAVYKKFNYDLDEISEHILFPDQVVYTFKENNLTDTLAAKETLWSYQYILNTIKKLNLTPNFLDRRYADILLNMESEKYRQARVKK